MGITKNVKYVVELDIMRRKCVSFVMEQENQMLTHIKKFMVINNDIKMKV